MAKRRVRSDPLDAPTPIEKGEAIEADTLEDRGVDWTPVTEDWHPIRRPRKAEPDPTIISGGDPTVPHATAKTEERPVPEGTSPDPTIISGQNIAGGARLAPRAPIQVGGFQLPRFETVDISLLGMELCCVAAILAAFAILFAPWPVEWGAAIRLVLLAVDALALGVAMLRLAIDGQRRRRMQEDQERQYQQVLAEIRRRAPGREE